MLGMKQLKPSDVTETSDGRFQKPVTRYTPTGETFQINTYVCERCWEPIPSYIDAPSGYVSCDSARKLRMTQIDGHGAIEARAKIVCYDCMKADYEEMYGGGFCESSHEIRG